MFLDGRRRSGLKPCKRVIPPTIRRTDREDLTWSLRQDNRRRPARAAIPGNLVEKTWTTISHESDEAMPRRRGVQDGFQEHCAPFVLSRTLFIDSLGLKGIYRAKSRRTICRLQERGTEGANYNR